MAESSILITWGRAETGRETMGLGVFQEALGYFDKQKSSGSLEDYKVGLVEIGDFGNSTGYLIAEGSNDQVNKVLDDDAFKTIVTKANHVVGAMNVQRCTAGTGISKRIERNNEVRNELGIS